MVTLGETYSDWSNVIVGPASCRSMARTGKMPALQVPRGCQ